MEYDSFCDFDDYILCAGGKAIRSAAQRTTHHFTEMFFDETRAVSGLRVIHPCEVENFAALSMTKVTFVLAHASCLPSFFS
jgi:hypothetical protein